MIKNLEDVFSEELDMDGSDLFEFVMGGTEYVGGIAVSSGCVACNKGAPCNVLRIYNQGVPYIERHPENIDNE